MDKLRNEMRNLSDATCDLIDAFKKFSNTFDEVSAVDPIVKEVIGNSVKETMVKLMYGDDAYVGKRFPYRKYYPYGRDDARYSRSYDSYREDINNLSEKVKILNEENEEDV